MLSREMWPSGELTTPSRMAHLGGFGAGCVGERPACSARNTSSYVQQSTAYAHISEARATPRVEIGQPRAPSPRPALHKSTALHKGLREALGQHDGRWLLITV